MTRQYKPWTTGDLKLLEKLWMEGKTIGEIASILDRSVYSVSGCIHTQRTQGAQLIRRRTAPTDGWAWTAEETDALVSMRISGMKYREIAETLGRTFYAVRQRLYMLHKDGRI